MAGEQNGAETTVVAPGEIMIATRCWSCGNQLVKSARRLLGSRHVSWSCDRCDVSWSERIVGRTDPI